MTDEKKLLEAQQAVLGAMLIDEKTVGPVLQDVTPDDFTTGAYRQIFLAFRAQFASGAACDPVTVNARLGGKYDRLLMELIEITPTSANVKSYVAILKQEARIHRLQDVAQRMLEAEDEDALRALMSEANALSVERPGLRVVSMEDALSKFYVRHDPDAKPVYLDFGMDDINDNVYAGRGDMIVIGGYPSDGKTSLALTLAVRMAKTQRVGFYSYETDADQLFDRIHALCRDSIILLISHRLHTFPKTSQVLWIGKDGKVTTSTHEKLLAENEDYRRLWALQNPKMHESHCEERR